MTILYKAVGATVVVGVVGSVGLAYVAWRAVERILPTP